MVTVTGPNQIVHPGLIVNLIKAKITQPRKLIRIADASTANAPGSGSSS